MVAERVIAIIPARGGSKGLPRKNVMPLDGKPLITYPIRAALASQVVDNVVVTTDDVEIAEIARGCGAEAPFVRPAEISGDLATTEDTLRHALATYEELTGRTYDIAVFLTATDVFRRVSWVREAVTRLKSEPALESVFSAHRTHKNFWVEAEDGTLSRILPWMRVYSNRQVRKPIFREDTGLACASRAWLWREGRRIGDKIAIIANDDPATGIDIHSEFDLYLAEQAIRYFKDKGRGAPPFED